MKSGTKYLLLFLVMLLLASVAACNSVPSQTTPTAVQDITLINALGPLVIPAAGISSGEVTGNVTVDVQSWKTIDEAIGLLAGDEVQFAVLPVTAAANISASGIDLVLLGVHEWKIFYLVSAEGSEFTDWSSLIGKTVYTPEAKGQTVDVLTRYALSRNGITPDVDVQFAYAPAQEIVALFKEGKVEYAALPEPFVTMAISAGGNLALDYQDYWAAESGTLDGIPIAGLFVKREFLEQHPNETQEVARLLADSTQWGNEHPDEALQASAEILPLPEQVMKAALPRMAFDYLPAGVVNEAVLKFLNTMKETYPEGIKAIPDESFFAE